MFAAAMVLAVSALADEAPQRRPGSPPVCFRRREINALSVLDDRHVLARLSAGRLYLLTPDKTCRGLRMVRKLALERAASKICGDGHSLLTFEDPGVGPTRCRIETIEPVASKAEALDLIDSREGPR